jgi:hypothetical protein
MATALTQYNPAPTGVTARYFGNSGGSTTRYYWLQAIYPSGKSTLAVSGAISSTLASLDGNNCVEVNWNPMAGAIGYNIFYTTTSTAPTTGAILVASVSGVGFSDKGQSNSGTLMTSVVVPDGFRVARARYDFSVDGGAIGLITLAQSDTIPAGAIMVGGTINPTTAYVGATATIAAGTSAGSSASALKAATAVASYSIDALLNLVPVFATPVKMTADGTITITVATAALTAGIADYLVYYVMPTAL